MFCLLTDEPLGQPGAFAFGDHPAGDVTAEDVQDHVEIDVVAPFLGHENSPFLDGGRH